MIIDDDDDDNYDDKNPKMDNNELNQLLRTGNVLTLSIRRVETLGNSVSQVVLIRWEKTRSRIIFFWKMKWW